MNRVSCEEHWDGVVVKQSNFLALQAFKQELIDPKGFLKIWNDSGPFSPLAHPLPSTFSKPSQPSTPCYCPKPPSPLFHTMGGRGRSRTQRKHFRDNRENVWKRSKSDPDASLSSDKTQTTHWAPFATQNPSFDSYYKEQLIVDPQEWENFITILRTPLPASFRINASSQFADDIRSQLENDFMHSLRAEVAEGGETEAIRPLLWYPWNFAWHSNFLRMQLRKNQTLERFHEF